MRSPLAPSRPIRALSPGALSAANPTSAKAAMLYTLRRSTWNGSAEDDVVSYAAALISAQNATAATTAATAIRDHLPSLDPGESS